MGSAGEFLSVGIGGMLGAMLRFGLVSATSRWTALTGLPLGTIAVNLLGCFAIGAFVGLADQRDVWHTSLRPFLVAGLLGGFTTFSAFGYESFALLRSGQIGIALLNALTQVLLGVAAVWFGYSLAAGR